MKDERYIDSHFKLEAIFSCVCVCVCATYYARLQRGERRANAGKVGDDSRRFLVIHRVRVMTFSLPSNNID